MSYTYPPQHCHPSPSSSSTATINITPTSTPIPPLSGTGINPPPPPRNRCIPLPSQFDADVVIHPTLQYRRTRTLRLEAEDHPPLDLIGTIAHPRSGHPASAHLKDWATQPKLPSLAILHPQLPWVIVVHPWASSTYVTVLDVIRSIAQSLAIPIDGDEGRSRVDLLGRNKRFVGLVRSDAGEDVWELCLV